MNFSTRIIFLLTLSVSIFSGNLLAQSQNSLPKLNQLGFYPDAEKIAITPEIFATSFHLRDEESGAIVFQAELTAQKSYPLSGESVKIADFSNFKRQGSYTLYVDGGSKSHPFEITNNVFNELSSGLIKALYYNRASTALDVSHAGIWARDAGHPDDNVLIHPSAATTERPANSTISSPGGWYDAGDYNKYVVPLSSSVHHMLFSYQQFPDFFASKDLNIPESSNNIPDILDEALYGLRWLLTMQDPNDGGVYHKLTTANFQGSIMPSQANATRYVVQKGTAATLTFAAVLAQAARVYEPFFPDFADSAIAAAELAYSWAQVNPNVVYNQNVMNTAFNPDISTGEYGGSNFSDELFWAKAELYITTKNDTYYPDNGWNNVGNSGWGDVKALGLYSLIHHRKELTAIGLSDTSALKSTLVNAFDWYVNDGNNSAYRSPFGSQSWQFNWGSNGGAGNLGMALSLVYNITGNTKYYTAAQDVLDYLLGRNAIGYSYVTGFGDKTPQNIHHRPSQYDGIAAPVPGWVAGGANPNNQDQDCGANRYNSTLAALSYLDDYCSYSTNEITTYWNSPFIYLTAALEVFTPLVAENETPLLSFNPIDNNDFYLPGDSVSVSWNVASPTNVNLLFKRFTDEVFTVIKSNTSATSINDFIIPNLPGDSLYFRIEDAGDPSNWAQSSLLRIKPSRKVSIQSLTTNNNFKPGDRIVLKWESTSVDFIDILMKLTSENDFTLVVSNLSAGTKTYNRFNVPDAPGDSLIIRIRDSEVDTVLSDSDPIQIATSVHNENEHDKAYSVELNQNYPNPFNPSTTINFTLQKVGKVRIAIYNSMGQQVAELVNNVVPEGLNSVVWNASDVASGVYYYQLENNGLVLTRKMTLIK